MKKSQIATVTLCLTHKIIIHIKDKADHIYESINHLGYRLAEAIKRHNSKLRQDLHKGSKMQNSAKDTEK